MKSPKRKTAARETSFDAIAWKRELQARFAAETDGLSTDQLLAYIHDRVANGPFASFLDQPVTGGGEG